MLIIGFGRFGQVVSQPLLARGVDVSIIDADVDMIRAAGNFGFKVYYGDGARLDVLRASGAGRADAILVCVDRPEAADRIVELAKHEFPLAKLYVRSFDRGHTLRLIAAPASSTRCARPSSRRSLFGERCWRASASTPTEVAETMADVRRRDQERLELQLVGGITAGRALMRGNVATPEPAPLTRPQHEAARPQSTRPPPRSSTVEAASPADGAPACGECPLQFGGDRDAMASGPSPPSGRPDRACSLPAERGALRGREPRQQFVAPRRRPEQPDVRRRRACASDCSAARSCSAVWVMTMAASDAASPSRPRALRRAARR